MVGADVVLEDRAVELFSIDATGSLTVRSALTLAQASGIEDLDLAADLSIGDTLTLSGANGVWRSGTIAGAGGLVLAGSASESGRLVVDSPGTVTLDTAATVGSIGNLAVDGGVLQIGETGSLLVEESGVVNGLFRGLFWRTALISTTFFLVNSFKQRIVPALFPHAVAADKPREGGVRS